MADGDVGLGGRPQQGEGRGHPEDRAAVRGGCVVRVPLQPAGRGQAVLPHPGGQLLPRGRVQHRQEGRPRFTS